MKVFVNLFKLLPNIRTGFTSLILLAGLGITANAQTSLNRSTSQILLQQNGVLENGDDRLHSDQTFVDRYTFSGQAGQSVLITLTSFEFDTYLMISDTSGSIIAQNDDRSRNDRNSEVSLSLPYTGTYTIIANAYSRSDQGAYTLTVIDTSPVTSSRSQVYTSPETSSRAQVSSNAGWQMLGSQSRLNYLSIPIYNYVGECPGRAIGRINTVFRSNTLEPMDDLEVEIRNVSAGMDSRPYPHIERDYDEGAASQVGAMTFGDDHIRVFIGQRTIAVMPGVNTFEYEIKDGSSVVERGDFISEVVASSRTIERNRQRVREEYCKTGQPMRLCDDDDVREREVLRCSS